MASVYDLKKGAFWKWLGSGAYVLDNEELSRELGRGFMDQWDDLRAPATALNLPGGANDADRDANDGTFLFSAITTEQILAVLQMPHGWKEESAIKPHVHWSKTTSAAGGVAWTLEYKWFDVGDAHGSYSSPVLATEAQPDDDTADQHAIATFGEVAGTGMLISSIFIARITRDHDHASDTYAADARLYEFDIHYQIDDRGSAQEFIKDP